MDLTLQWCMYYNKPSFFNPGETSLDAYRTMLTGIGGESFEDAVKKELKYIKSLFSECPIMVSGWQRGLTLHLGLQFMRTN